MKNSIEQINHRRDQIFNAILLKGEVTVEELAQTLNVSEVTIRRDLLFFEEKKYIERFYGGARLLSKHNDQNPSKKMSYTKHSIAKATAQLIDSGDTIFINTSSTALLVLRYLDQKYVTVITNNAKAVTCKSSPNVTIILTGGELRYPKESMVGDFALQTIRNVSVSKSILGCSGFSLDIGMTTSIHSEVSINRLMLENCKGPRILCVDHSKLGQTANFISGNVTDFDVIVTDREADTEFLGELALDYKIKTIVAD